MSTGPLPGENGAPESLCVQAAGLNPLDLAEVFGQPPRRLEIDLGCGKGRFLLARAAAHPAVSFLGLDRRSSRLLKVARRAQRQRLTNLRLFLGEAAQAVRYLIPGQAVSVYYIFFPDPWPKRRHHRRRLFKAEFLSALHHTLAPGGVVHVATDHQDYFQSIRRFFLNDSRFQEIPPFEPRAEERTDFERIFLNRQAAIGRCSFRTAP